MHLAPNGIGGNGYRPLAWFTLRFPFIGQLYPVVYAVAYQVHQRIAQGF
jgi:hypothetical protein